MNTQKIRTLTDLLQDPNAVLLTLPEVAAVLRRDVKAVRTMTANGDLKAKKLGGNTYVTRSEILSLLDVEVPVAS